MANASIIRYELTLCNTVLLFGLKRERTHRSFAPGLGPDTVATEGERHFPVGLNGRDWSSSPVPA
jgi:hypothetical protein